MDVRYRDEITNTLEGYYSRRVFLGDMTLDEAPKDIREKVEEELKNTGLIYLTE